jgi:hypothetical protein
VCVCDEFLRMKESVSSRRRPQCGICPKERRAAHPPPCSLKKQPPPALTHCLRTNRHHQSNRNPGLHLSHQKKWRQTTIIRLTTPVTRQHHLPHKQARPTLYALWKFPTDSIVAVSRLVTSATRRKRLDFAQPPQERRLASDDWRWTMPSNDSGQSRGLEIVVAFFVVVFLAFLFFGDQFGAVSNQMSVGAKEPTTASQPWITSPLAPPEVQPNPAAPSS